MAALAVEIAIAGQELMLAGRRPADPQSRLDRGCPVVVELHAC